MNRCDIRKIQNKHLKAVKCCLTCHKAKSAAEGKGGEVESEWTCCEMWHFENAYRPSARKQNPLTS